MFEELAKPSRPYRLYKKVIIDIFQKLQVFLMKMNSSHCHNNLKHESDKKIVYILVCFVLVRNVIVK